MRKTKEELEQIKKENNVDTLWSWSRVSSWWTSKYEWFLNYVLHETPDRLDCIYGQEGGYSHDILEKYYNNEIQFQSMSSEFRDSWDMARHVLELKFDRNNPEQDNKIATRYFENLEHFFKNHNPIKYDLVTEDFVTIKIGDNVLIGYIDAWYKDENGDIHIVDWKTSSIYTGATLTEKSGQLMCYALSFMQKGIPIDKIHIKFNFLKYATITYEQANGKIKNMNVERRLLGEKLQSPCKMWLKKFGYEPDEYLKTVLDTSDIECLPLEVQDKISIKDCYVEVPITESAIKIWADKISETIHTIESSIMMYETLDDESVFHDSLEEVKNQSYYFATLSEYSPNKNPCYKKYLDSIDGYSVFTV